MPLGKALLEGGGKAASFEEIGDTLGGVVISAEFRQATDLDSGKPGFWDNGDPKQNAIITVQTDERDPAVPGDDGARSIYVKWWGPNKVALQTEIRTKTANLPEDQQDIIKGGYFQATLTDKIPPTTRGFSHSKVFGYRYTPPAAGGLGAAAINGGGPVERPVAQNQHPAQTYAPQATEQPPVQQIPQQQAPAQQAAAPAAAPTSAPATDPMEVIKRIKTLAAPPVSMDAVAISALVPQYSVEAITAILGV